MNKLKPYYAYVGIPIALVTAGTVIFSRAIMSTVNGNPHPEINYVLFFLIATGMIMMMMHIFRLNREGRIVKVFFDKLNKANQHQTELAKDQVLGEEHADVRPVLEMLYGLRGKPITTLQHDALEHELTRFEAKQARRLLLAQYMGGLMVGMGLLGTFIGLLGALSEIGKLIGAFGGAVNVEDPVAMVQELVARLTAPMQAMGVAFSASLFGVLGSLIMGVLLVSVKSCASELANGLRSLTNMETDFSGNHEFGLTLDVDPLQQALQDLAEKTPTLKLLTAALDQSERRVRELVTSLGSLTARLTDQGSSLDSLITAVGSRSDLDQRVQEGVLRHQEAMERLTGQLSNALQNQGQVAQLLQGQLAQQDTFLTSAQALIGASSQNIATQAQQQMQQLVDTLRMQLSAQHAAIQEGNTRATDASESAQKVLQQHQAAMAQVQQWLEKSVHASATEASIRTKAAQRLEAIVEEYHSRQEQMVQQWLEGSKR